MSALRVGMRRSPLALAQSRRVAERLEKALVDAGRPGEVELVEVTTEGDRSAEPLTSIGGTGVFVSALRDALLAGSIDVAVHSAKDLPTAQAAGLVVAAVPERVDPRDPPLHLPGRPATRRRGRPRCARGGRGPG